MNDFAAVLIEGLMFSRHLPARSTGVFFLHEVCWRLRLGVHAQGVHPWEVIRLEGETSTHSRACCSITYTETNSLVLQMYFHSKLM